MLLGGYSSVGHDYGSGFTHMTGAANAILFLTLLLTSLRTFSAGHITITRSSGVLVVLATFRWNAHNSGAVFLLDR
ncbi:MAG: hypothetical protein ACI9CO_000490 [Candidatus Azotimanducaceae bacterium]|jgi:hypothetical protein